MSRRFQSGLAAEEIAERAYAAKGAEVLARRYRTALGEIDLIVQLAGTVVFVEVKQRARPGPDSPITPRQWSRIAAAAQAWLAETGTALPCRFDAALVGPDGGLSLVEGAHVPGLD